jgi:hypothetical protein
MDWKNEFDVAQDFVSNRQYDLAATKYKEIIEGTEGQDKYHYWALKHFADLLGFIYMKDYFQAIDLYQRIINEYEEEDGLYEWCQIDMARSYLNMSMELMASYENMEEFLEYDDPQMREHISKLKEKREDFITDRAESIYKGRM